MTVAWTPPLLQSHGPNAVWNALISQCGTSIPLAGKGVTAVIEPTSSPQHTRVAVLIQAAGLRAVVIFDSFPFAALFEANLEADDLDRLPVALRDVLIEGMLSTFWSQIPQNRLPCYAILGIGDWQESAAEAGSALDWLTISIQGMAPQAGRLRIGCVAVDVARAIAGGQISTRAAWDGLRVKLTAEAFFTLGRLTAPLAKLRALAPGDVVVLAASNRNLAKLRLRHELHEFRLADEEWTYAGLSRLQPRRRETELREEQDMSNDPADDDEKSGELNAPNVSALMLDLDFDLGAIQLPLAEIEGWQVGSVVDFDPPIATDGVEVIMRINGQAIARGDLISIDDRLAVRVTRLLLGA